MWNYWWNAGFNARGKSHVFVDDILGHVEAPRKGCMVAFLGKFGQCFVLKLQVVSLACLDISVLFERGFDFQFYEQSGEVSARFQDEKVGALEPVFLDRLVPGLLRLGKLQ